MKCVLFVGSGAVKNAWAPVLRAVGSILPEVRTPDVANFALAGIVYQRRVFETVRPTPEVKCRRCGRCGRCKHCRRQTDGASRSKLEDQQVAKLNVVLTYERLRSAIADELQKAEQNREIEARAELAEIVDSFATKSTSGGQLAVLTTNWDTTIPKRVAEVVPWAPTHHLHGTAQDARSLYLPSETSTELYRPEEEERATRSIHGAALATVKEATRVVLYGLALSALDAELGIAVAFALKHGCLEDVYVIDPVWEQVAARVQAFRVAEDKRTPIRCYHPDNLKRETVFLSQ